MCNHVEINDPGPRPWAPESPRPRTQKSVSFIPKFSKPPAKLPGGWRGRGAVCRVCNSAGAGNEEKQVFLRNEAYSAFRINVSNLYSADLLLKSAAFPWITRKAAELLWVRDDILDPVRIVRDCEIEAPVAIHAGLPDVAELVVFLGME